MVRTPCAHLFMLLSAMPRDTCPVCVGTKHHPRPPHTALFDLPCHSESNCDPVIVGARFGRRSGGAGLRRVVNSAPTGEGLR